MGKTPKAEGLRVNIGESKIMNSSKNEPLLKDSGKHPCGVCMSSERWKKFNLL